MQLHKALADAQAQARPSMTPANVTVQLLERPEDPIPVFGTNTRTCVCHADHDVTPFLPGADVDPALLREATGVAQQVQDDLPNARGVAENRWQALWHFHIQIQPL